MKHVHSIMVLARNNKHQNLINAKQYNVVLSQQCITPFISQTGEQLLTADNKFVSCKTLLYCSGTVQIVS